MTSKRPTRAWKKWTAIALGLLLVADAGLGVFLWHSSNEGPQKMSAERDRLGTLSKLLKAEVDRDQRIRESLPQVGKDCEAFYRQWFLDASIGYSSITEDLAGIANKAGLKDSGLSFNKKDAKDRGVTAILITTSVEGNYAEIIQFINGLERSKNLYLLNDLHLSSASGGAIKLDLVLRTYFRT